MTPRLWRAVEKYFLAPKLANGEVDAQRRARFVLRALAIAGLLTLVRGFVLLVTGTVLQACIALTLSTTCVGCAFLLRSTGAVRVVGNIFSAAFFAAITSLTFRRGGVGSPPTIAFGIVPLMAVLLSGRRSGLFWAGACITELLVLVAVDPPLVDQFRDRNQSFGLFGGITVITLSLLIALAYESTKDDALRARDLAERQRSKLSAQRIRLSNDLEAARRDAREHQADRLRSLGGLAAGIAHDFNNLLVAILNFSEFAIQELKTDPSLALGSLEEVRRAADRAAELTQQLLSFGRQHPARLEIVDLQKLVDDTLTMLRRLVPENIRIEHHSHGAVLTRADNAQLEQLLVNLCLNARDALPNGGNISIRTSREPVSHELMKKAPFDSPECVVLCVKDNGTGMDAETHARCFEPFFTTKDKSSGTGLGLSTVYGIAREHGAVIDIATVLGAGTTFSVYLPAASPERQVSDKRLSDRSKAIKETTILVAEDDPVVRNVATRILRGAGYTVLAASSGEEAIKVFDGNADAIELLVLDIIMPRMSGKEAYERLAERKPGLRALFTSGYSNNVLSSEFLAEPTRALLPKPYRSEELIDAVRGLLSFQKSQ